MLPALLLPLLNRSAAHPNERADFFCIQPRPFSGITEAARTKNIDNSSFFI